MKPELLIWNLDGVVVGISNGIDAAVRRTVQNYFSHFLGIHGSGSLVEEADLQTFRLAGGLDHPWELSAALIRYLLSLLPEMRRGRDLPTDTAQAVAFLKSRSQPVQGLSLSDLRERADFAATARALREAGGGLHGLARTLPGGLAHPLWMYEGAVREGGLIKRLYQELYLGQYHFTHLEKERPRLYRGPGMIENETLRLDQHQLQQLRAHYRSRMALVTDRSRPVAELTLRRSDADRLFDTMVTFEDATGEEARQQRLGQDVGARKPYPYMILEAAAHLDPSGARPTVVIGFTPDDIRAAHAAGEAGERRVAPWAIMPRSIPSGATEWEERLRDAGAERLFDEPSALVAELLPQEP